MKKFLLSILCLFCVVGISAQTNIASNPGFENWEGEVAVDWAGPIGHNATISQSTDARTGNYSIAVSGASSNKRLASKSYTLAAGTYTFSVYVKANGDEAGFCRLGYVPVVDGEAGSYTYESANASATTAEWTERVYEFTLAEETTIALIVMNNKNGGGASFLVDDVTLTNGEATEGGEGGDENEGETDVTYKTIAEVLAAGAGEAATKGTVVATYARGFLMSDETGTILVYLNAAPAVTVGDAVTVSGKTSTYGGLLQFAAGSTVEKTGTATVTHPAATVMDGAAMDAYLSAPVVKYVEYTGTLTINGSYYNVAVEGASTAIGSIQYPNTGLVTAASGDVVKVTGYTIGTSSSKYVNTMAVKVETVDNGGNEGEGEGEGEGDVTYKTIAEVLAAGAGEAATKGTVVATYARGFLMSDETGTILVYLNAAPAVVAGDAVTVSGKTSTYGGLLQFAAGSTVEKTGTATVTHPAATVMDGSAMDAYLSAPVVKYVEYTGTLTINNNYYNVAVEGATTAIGSIQYPQDAIKANLTSGSVVKVTGYTIGVSSSKYVNTMAVTVEVVGEGGGEEPETPTETQEYTVTEALAAYVDGQQIPAIVTGYIVGAVNSAPETGSQFGAEATIATNILISDNPDTNDYTECLIVQLPSGDIRSALNLVDNPGNYKKQVKLTGSVEKYFRVAGLKSVTAYEFTGTTGIENVKGENGKVKTIFDLTGRRVENITAPGIYIVNGKKVLVK